MTKDTKKHLIITGGAGFIGSHLCDAFLARGYKVSAVDNFITGNKDNLIEASKNPDFYFLEWDVIEKLPEEKLPFIKTNGVHGVLHLACPASPIDFDLIPFDILKVDSLGTIHTVDLARRYNARYLVTSTSEIYGDPEVHPQKETYFGNVSSIGPRACYDETKRFAEAYVSSSVRGVKAGRNACKPLNGAICRIFNTYGPRMRPNDGRVVPEFFMQALQGRPLMLHGEGRQTRSFCYVSDLVSGIIKLFESNEFGPFNLGNPVEKTIREFAEIILSLVKTGSKLEFAPARPEDPRKRCPDITKAKTVLGWAPKVDLQEGLKKTLDFFKDFVK